MPSYTKLKVIWKNNLNNIYKENTIIAVGQEAVINFTDKEVAYIQVVFEVNNETYAESVEIKGNVVNVPFKPIVLKPGKHKLEIIAYLKNGDVIPSPTFSYYVEESLASPNDVTSDINYPILIELIEKVEELNNDITLAEEERQSNEDNRQSNEEIRKAQEEMRIANEIERQRKIEEAEQTLNEIDNLNVLKQINQEDINNWNSINEIDNLNVLKQINQEDIDNWNSGTGMTDEEREQLANKFDDVQYENNELVFYSNNEVVDRVKIQSGTGMTDEEREQLANKFDDVVVNEEKGNDGQTALDFYANGRLVKTIYFTGGGGGGTSAYISSTTPVNLMVTTGQDLELLIDFSSPNLGRGTLKVSINDIDAMSTSIEQGENTITISNENLTKGTNRVNVYVLDRVGQMSNTLTFYVRYGSTELTSDFDAYSSYDYGATVRYYFTPTAVDTSLSLTFYMTIDGQVQNGVTCTSDTRGYYTFPNNLSVGSHYCEAYIMDSNDVKSNVLTFNLIIIDANSLIVASDTKNITIEEGQQLSLDYKVYMKNNSLFITKIYIDNNLVNTGTCGLDFNYYKTSSLTEGIHSIKLEVWDITEKYSDYIIWTITVTPSTYEMKQPVNAGATFIGSAVNKSNADERKNFFVGKNQEGVEVLGNLYNFAFNSENGWVDDELIISGNSYAEIPIQPLKDNAKYGFTLDIEFTSRMIGIEDAEVLTLWNNEKNCGIKITTEHLILRSAEGNECNLYFTDDERTNVIFVIDRNELKAKIYLNGVMCQSFHLSDYTIDGVAYLEDFTVNSNIILGGKNKNGYSKIRNLRVYQIALTTDEIINNFISCEIDKGKQRELVEFQKGSDLPTLTVYCDFSGLGKDDKKPCRIVYTSTDEQKYGKSFILDHKQSQLQYQGTSSMAYPIKNYRLNLRDEKGDKWYYELPGSQPECRFTLKADFITSNHAHNTGMAKFINDNLYNYNLNDEKSINPFKWNHIQNGGNINDFREAINGFPCRLILVNDGNSPLNEGQNEPTPGNTKDMGIFNFNNDKDNVTTLGFDSDIFPNCASYEVTANSDTSAGAFMSYELGEEVYRDYEGQSITITDNELWERKATAINEIQGNTINSESLGVLQKDGTYEITLYSSNAPYVFGKGGRIK